MALKIEEKSVAFFMFFILKNHDFKYFWFSRVGTALAYQMLSVAVGWKIYELTHSTFYLGLVGLMQFLPMLFLTLRQEIL